MSGAGDTPSDGAHIRDCGSNTADAQYADMVDVVPDYRQEPAPVANGKATRVTRKSDPPAWDIVLAIIKTEQISLLGQVFLMRLAQAHVKDQPLKFANAKFEREHNVSVTGARGAIEKLLSLGVIQKVELDGGNTGRSSHWYIRGIHY